MPSPESNSSDVTPPSDEVLVERVLSMGVIPQLRSGESYASNAIPGLVGRVLGAYQLPGVQDRIQRLVGLVTASLEARGITVKPSRSLASHGSPKRGQSRWRNIQQDLSTLTADEQNIVDDIATAAIVAMHGSSRSRNSIESAAHIRLSDHGKVPLSRMRVMTDAVIARIEELMEQHQVGEEETSDAPVDDYDGSDPDADLAELAAQGIDPTKPTTAKPGPDRVGDYAARYAAGRPLWDPNDKQGMTSPQDEDRLRRQRVEASEKAANLVRDNVAALKDN